MPPLHITSGDCAGASLAKAGLPGDVFVWHDLLYDGPRVPGWPDDDNLRARAEFIHSFTGGGLDRADVYDVFVDQYKTLKKDVANQRPIVLWFDACLFDMAMLVHLLTCLSQLNATDLELLCVDAFPGVDPYHGLGQLSPEQLASVYDDRRPVTPEQLAYAQRVDDAFVTHDTATLTALAEETDTPLPWVPAAINRLLAERPDPTTGLGRLKTLSVDSGETLGTLDMIGAEGYALRRRSAAVMWS